MTLSQENCYRRELDVFDGAAGRGVSPRRRLSLDPSQGDSQFAPLKCSRGGL